MTCIVYPDENASAPFTLASHPGIAPEDEIAFNGKRILQVQDFLRATYAEVYFRGNRVNTFGFNVARTYDTELKAFLALLDHEGEVPGGGVFEFGIKVGGQSAKRWMRGAVESVDLVRDINLTKIWRYTIIGGEVFKTNPNQGV